MVEFNFEAIGTLWQVSLFAQLSTSAQATVKDSILSRIEEFDAVYSRFRKDSLVTKIASAAGSYKFPPDSGKLFEIYRQMYDISGGQVTPLIGQVLSDAGYDANYSFKSKVLQTPPSWDMSMQYHGGLLTTTRPLLLDFGAAGKGYLVDIVSRIIRQMGYEDFCVDAGGDMYYSTTSGKAMRVGLEDPDDSSRVLGVCEITGGSICGSAGNRRTWGEFHHIIDPYSLSSPRTIKAVWVYADSCMLADAMSTALYFVPQAVLTEQFPFEFLVITEGESLIQSANFPVELFMKPAVV